MSTSDTQGAVVALISLALLVAVVHLSRRGQLSFRYTMGWISVASIGILGVFLLRLAAPIAGKLALSPAALLVLVAFIFFLAITIQLSISISGLQQQNRTLAEEIARLRHETRTSPPRDD